MNDSKLVPHTPVTEDEPWGKWSAHVLFMLKLNHSAIESLKEENAALRARLAVAEVRSGFVGLVGGIIPALGVLIYFLVSQ